MEGEEPRTILRLVFMSTVLTCMVLNMWSLMAVFL